MKSDLSKSSTTSNSVPMAAQPGAGQAAASDDQVDAARHDRNYNPVDSAPRGSIGAALNADAARYKQGPGPV